MTDPNHLIRDARDEVKNVAPTDASRAATETAGRQDIVAGVEAGPPATEMPQTVTATKQDFIAAAGYLGVTESLAHKAWLWLADEFAERKGEEADTFPVRFLKHPPKDDIWGNQRIDNLVIASLGEYLDMLDKLTAGKEGRAYQEQLPRGVGIKMIAFWQAFVRRTLDS